MYRNHHLKYFLLIISSFSLLTIGCADNPNSGITKVFNSTSYNAENVVAEVLKAVADTNNALWQHPIDSLIHTEDLEHFYGKQAKGVLWLKGDKVSVKGKYLLSQIDSVTLHGINPEYFGKSSLAKLASSVRDHASAAQFEFAMSLAYTRLARSIVHGAYAAEQLREEWYCAADSFSIGARCLSLFQNDSVQHLLKALQPQQPEYAALVKKLSALRITQSKGTWPAFTISADSAAQCTSEKYAPLLRKRLFAEVGLPLDTTSASLDTLLLTAIHQFQYLHNLKSTGVIDTTTLRRLKLTVADKITTVRSNLERIRWMTNTYSLPYVYVNIPYMELEYRDVDTTSFKMRVVVGRVSRPTPTLDAAMSNIVFNPPWSVPPTIMKEEIVPGVSKKGGSYLARRGLKAYLGGREVDASRINATNYKMFTISQKPGLNSSLGAVKFNLPNRHAIYLHDTPHREDFVKNYRAYSSGCIRVHHPREFAEFLLQDANYSKPRIDSLVKNRQTKEVQLKKKLPVHIVYLTNAIDSVGNVLFLRDIYAQDSKLNAVWN
jgi:L,D-transpeptidase YcbB